MEGTAEAPGAVTILNALATGTGSAVAIDRTVTAEVGVDDTGEVVGIVGGAPNLGPRDGDPALIERCVELALETYADRDLTNPQLGATVRTESDLPVAVGLKSSSAAANAAVLATCEALGTDPDPIEATKLGVRAARDVGVTVTGAFDDAAASMLGGVVVTDNDEDELLATDDLDWSVLVWVPPERSYTADVDVDRCRRIASMADLAAELALDGRYVDAMSVNGFAFAAALGYSMDPLVDALPAARAVSPSGTGPAIAAVGEREALESLRESFADRAGTVWITEARTTGARVL